MQSKLKQLIDAGISAAQEQCAVESLTKLPSLYRTGMPRGHVQALILAALDRHYTYFNDVPWHVRHYAYEVDAWLTRREPVQLRLF